MDVRGLTAHDTKTCRSCGETLPLDMFRAGRRCRPCDAAWLREYRANMTPEERKAKQPVRSEAAIERRRQQNRESAARRREHRAAQKKIYEAENREKIRARKAAYAEANRERLREASRAWRQANPESVAESTRRYRERNPEIRTLLNQNRRARQGGDKVSKVELRGLAIGDCPLCDESIDPNLAWPNPLSRSIDHIVPLAQGGRHHIDNLQWAHLVCNVRKGARTA